MYYKVKVEDAVRVPPMFFSGDIGDSIKKILDQEIVGAMDKDLGVIVAITNVENVGEGYIVPSDGAVYYEVKYETLVYKPTLQEVVEGEFKEAAEFGAFVTIGPIDGLVHVSQIMEDYVSFNEKESQFLGKESKRILKLGDGVRVRVVTVSKKSTVLDTKIGLTMRQPCLGALHWKETKSATAEKKSGEDKDATKGATSKRPSQRKMRRK